MIEIGLVSSKACMLTAEEFADRLNQLRQRVMERESVPFGSIRFVYHRDSGLGKKFEQLQRFGTFSFRVSTRPIRVTTCPYCVVDSLRNYLKARSFKYPVHYIK